MLLGAHRTDYNKASDLALDKVLWHTEHRTDKSEDVFPNAPNSSKANDEHSETCNEEKLKNFIKSQYNAKL